MGLCVISSNHLISGCVRAAVTFSDQEKKPHSHVHYRLGTVLQGLSGSPRDSETNLASSCLDFIVCHSFDLHS